MTIDVPLIEGGHTNKARYEMEDDSTGHNLTDNQNGMYTIGAYYSYYASLLHNFLKWPKLGWFARPTKKHDNTNRMIIPHHVIYYPIQHSFPGGDHDSLINSVAFTLWLPSRVLCAVAIYNTPLQCLYD